MPPFSELRRNDDTKVDLFSSAFLTAMVNLTGNQDPVSI